VLLVGECREAKPPTLAELAVHALPGVEPEHAARGLRHRFFRRTRRAYTTPRMFISTRNTRQGFQASLSFTSVLVWAQFSDETKIGEYLARAASSGSGRGQDRGGGLGKRFCAAARRADWLGRPFESRGPSPTHSLMIANPARSKACDETRPTDMH